MQFTSGGKVMGKKCSGEVAAAARWGGWLLMAALLGVIGCGKNSPEEVIPRANTFARDGAVKTQMRTIYRAEESFRSKKGRYGTIPDLVESGDLNGDPDNERLFKYSISASEERFECIGQPMIYKTTGLLSFYIDQTGQLRGADHNGGRASADDPVIVQ